MGEVFGRCLFLTGYSFYGTVKGDVEVAESPLLYKKPYVDFIFSK